MDLLAASVAASNDDWAQRAHALRPTVPDCRFRRWRAEERSWARAGRRADAGAARGAAANGADPATGASADSATGAVERDVAPAKQRRVGAVIVAGGGCEIGAQRALVAGAAPPARPRPAARAAVNRFAVLETGDVARSRRRGTRRSPGTRPARPPAASRAARRAPAVRRELIAESGTPRPAAQSRRAHAIVRRSQDFPWRKRTPQKR